MRLFIFLTLLVGCGSNESAAPMNLTTASVDEGEPASEGEPTAEAESHALLVADASKLPACDVAGEGRLVYVKADAAFMACASGAWEAIDLRGAKGDKGDLGDAGADAEPLSSTAWLDPITESIWIAATDGNWATAQLACSGAYRLPTEGELLDAALHGLLGGLSGTAIGWAAPDSGNSWNYIVTISANPVAGSDTKTNTNGIYCVKDGE